MSTLPNANSLFLHEEILLLGLRDDKGTPERGTAGTLAFGGALLAELLLHERIEIEEDRKARVIVTDPTPIGKVGLDHALEKIRTSKRQQSAATWVATLGGTKEVRTTALEGLCHRGILSEQQHKILGLFPRKVYPETDPGPEREFRARIERAATEDGGDVDERTAILVAIAHPTGLLQAVYGRRWIKDHKARIVSIGDDLSAGKATRDAIAAVQAVIIATTTAAAAATVITTVT